MATEDRRSTRRRFLQTAAVGLGAGHLLAGTPTPAVAQEGLAPVFFDDFDSASTIDVNATDNPGYNWYPRRWFHANWATSSANITVANSVLTLGGNGGGEPQGRAELASAFANQNAPHFRGTVFGQGGLFEARIAFDHAEAPPSPGYAPAFWSMAIEHIAYEYVQTWYTQWPGQEPGYAHYMELDFMEHFRAAGHTDYVTTVHDWSGKYEPFWWHNISNKENNLPDVGPVDWSEFHTYACRWTPQNGTTPGSILWYLDDLASPVTEIFYKGPVGDPPLPGQGGDYNFTPDTPGEAARTYAKLDQQHYALNLSCDENWPMHVDWVRVWESTVGTGN